MHVVHEATTSFNALSPLPHPLSVRAPRYFHNGIDIIIIIGLIMATSIICSNVANL